MTKQTFTKHERIYLRDEVRQLFVAKESFMCYPLRVLCLEKTIASTDKPRVKVLISVPKRRFKRAVDRNLLKRRFREAYRLQKGDFITALEQQDDGKRSQLLLGFIYISDQIATHKELGVAVSKAFRKYLTVRQSKIEREGNDTTEKDL